MTDNAKHTDLGFLENFTGGDRARMKKYITMFLNAAPGDAQKIQEGSAAQDWEKMRASAHSLRPQMTYMGIKRGEALLRQMENNVLENQNHSELPTLAAQFAEIFNAACSELKETLNQID